MKDGLRFECQQCGVCCRGPEPGYVWVSDAEVLALARRLELSREAFGRRFLRQVGSRLSLVERANHDCVFWQDGAGCTVYEDRPVQCRTFPFWPEFLASPAAWNTIEWCHGKDKGRVYSAAEIERLSRGEGATGPGEPTTPPPPV